MGELASCKLTKIDYCNQEKQEDIGLYNGSDTMRKILIISIDFLMVMIAHLNG